MAADLGSFMYVLKDVKSAAQRIDSHGDDAVSKREILRLMENLARRLDQLSTRLKWPIPDEFDKALEVD